MLLHDIIQTYLAHGNWDGLPGHVVQILKQAEHEERFATINYIQHFFKFEKLSDSISELNSDERKIVQSLLRGNGSIDAEGALKRFSKDAIQRLIDEGILFPLDNPKNPALYCLPVEFRFAHPQFNTGRSSLVTGLQLYSTDKLRRLLQFLSQRVSTSAMLSGSKLQMCSKLYSIITEYVDKILRGLSDEQRDIQARQLFYVFGVACYYAIGAPPSEML